MKRILLSLIAVICLTGIAFGQTPTLDQHNQDVISDSIAAIAGQTVDTSTVIAVGYYNYFKFFGYVDSIGTGASSSVNIYVDIAPTVSGPWFVNDTITFDSTLTTLRANTSYRYEDLDATVQDGRYLRFRTAQLNGTNDSSLVSWRLMRKE